MMREVSRDKRFRLLLQARRRACSATSIALAAVLVAVVDYRLMFIAASVGMFIAAVGL
jgi:hypothetical protein